MPMHALWGLAISNCTIALLGSVAAARWRCAKNPVEALVVGYLLGSTLLIALTYATAWFGSSHRLLVWGLWLLVWGVLAFGGARRHPPVPTGKRRFAWPYIGLLLLTLAGAGLWLVDPARHASPASVTAYHFVDFLASFLHESTVYHDYILGLPILLGQTRLFQNDALELMRWGPPLLAAAGIPAFFVLLARLFGRRTAWLSAVCLAGSAVFLPLAGLRILFPQFVPLGLALPALLFHFPRALRPGKWAERLVAAAALLFLSFTATYFALLVVAGFGAWLLLNRTLRKIGWASVVRGAVLLAIVPAWIAFHYGAALPRFQPQGKDSHYENRIEAFARNPVIPAAERAAIGRPNQESESSPTWRGLRMFCSPKRLDVARPTAAQTVLFWLVVALAFPLLKHPASGRGLLGFTMLFSAFGTVTGMFDLPGYQGRHLYLLLLLGIPSAAFFAISRLIPLAQHLSIRAGLPLGEHTLFRAAMGLVLLSCLPAIRHPPEAGHNFPASPDGMIRHIPEDDLLLALARSVPADQPQSLIFLARENDPRLPGELVENLNRTPGFSGLQFHRVAPSRISRFDVFTQAPPRYAVLTRADWDALESQPDRTWDGLPLGDPVFQTDRIACVRLRP